MNPKKLNRYFKNFNFIFIFIKCKILMGKEPQDLKPKSTPALPCPTNCFTLRETQIESVAHLHLQKGEKNKSEMK
jgi:hypothetical protein